MLPHAFNLFMYSIYLESYDIIGLAIVHSVNIIWMEPIDEEVDIRQLYQIQNNADYIEPNIYGELHLGNQDSVGYNSDA